MRILHGLQQRIPAALGQFVLNRAGYATRSRSRSEYGSISTTIFLTAALGALRGGLRFSS